MKDKILLFIIGVLVGAIISTGAFFVYTKTTTNNTNNSQMQMPGGTPPSMSGGNETGQRPERPDNMQDSNTSQDNNQTSSN